MVSRNGPLHLDSVLILRENPTLQIQGKDPDVREKIARHHDLFSDLEFPPPILGVFSLFTSHVGLLAYVYR